jgi:hypothetical protein
MINILEPILNNNQITYPVIIDNTLHNFNIKYNIDNINLNPNIDGIVPTLISIAICNKWKIYSKFPIDIKLYENLLNIPETFKKYHHKHTYLLKMVTREEIKLILDMPTCERSNIYYKHITPISMGVDSLHTILTNMDKLTHLIYVNKLDLSNKINDFNSIIKNIANKFNKQLIIAKSNIKQIMEDLCIPGTNYSVFTNDAIILALCYPLGINTIYFSGLGGDVPFLSGQHSELNKYYCGNEFNSIHNDTLRIKKIKYILENDIYLLSTLRVCNDDTSNTNFLNCSNCGKCIYTLTYIYMLGYIEEAITFIRDENLIDYFFNTYSKIPNKLLFEIFDEKELLAFIKLYKSNNNSLIDILDQYDGTFINDEFVLTKN